MDRQIEQKSTETDQWYKTLSIRKKKGSIPNHVVRLVFSIRRSEQTLGKRQNWIHSPHYTERIRDQQEVRSIQIEIYYILINGTVKMFLFLFFLHLIKYSQRNVNMSYYDYVFFSFPLYFFWFLLNVSLLLGI